ncbi:hypothetical protein B0H11DRAFT_239064, partial [Mycena galericulata]
MPADTVHLPSPLSPPPSPEHRRKSFPLECSDVELYVRLMLPQGLGYPMWCPGPNLDPHVPLQYRRLGTSIGDVGMITQDGIFDFVFNVLLPTHDPINNRAPQGFSPYPWSGNAIQSYLPPNTCVRQGNIRMDGSPAPVISSTVYDFLINPCPGAICVLPSGAIKRGLPDISDLQEYAIS